MVPQNGQANSRYHCSVSLLSWFLCSLRPILLRQTCLRLMYAPAQTKTPSPHLFATSICFAPLCRSFRRPCRFRFHCRRCHRCRYSESLPSWLLRGFDEYPAVFRQPHNCLALPLLPPAIVSTLSILGLLYVV